jgi:hypothetical protein
MLKPIVTVTACIVALMVVVKDGRALRMAGLTGSCAIVRTYADSTSLVACRPGKLGGRPALPPRVCTSAPATPTVQYWHCAAGFDISYESR